MNEINKEDALTLEILETIEGQSDVTQRHLADRLGVALGLANSYLKRCVRKGFIKITQAPANRYLYYVTPKGFAEKSRLTAEYLSSSFEFYRGAGASCTRVFQQCHARQHQTILLGGLSELAEIASLRAKEQGITVIGSLDTGATTSEFIGLPVWGSVDTVTEFDACVITAISGQQELLQHLAERLVDKQRIYIPDILRINMA